MKLDKIKFAELVKYITSLRPEVHFEVSELDALIDIKLSDAEHELTNKIGEWFNNVDCWTGGNIRGEKATELAKYLLK